MKHPGPSQASQPEHEELHAIETSAIGRKRATKTPQRVVLLTGDPRFRIYKPGPNSHKILKQTRIAQSAGYDKNTAGWVLLLCLLLNDALCHSDKISMEGFMIVSSTGLRPSAFKLDLLHQGGPQLFFVPAPTDWKQWKTANIGEKIMLCSTEMKLQNVQAMFPVFPVWVNGKRGLLADFNKELPTTRLVPSFPGVRTNPAALVGTIFEAGQQHKVPGGFVDVLQGRFVLSLAKDVLPMLWSPAAADATNHGNVCKWRFTFKGKEVRDTRDFVAKHTVSKMRFSKDDASQSSELLDDAWEDVDFPVIDEEDGDPILSLIYQIAKMAKDHPEQHITYQAAREWSVIYNDGESESNDALDVESDADGDAESGGKKKNKKKNKKTSKKGGVDQAKSTASNSKLPGGRGDIRASGRGRGGGRGRGRGGGTSRSGGKPTTESGTVTSTTKKAGRGGEQRIRRLGRLTVRSGVGISKAPSKSASRKGGDDKDADQDDAIGQASLGTSDEVQEGSIGGSQESYRP